MRCAFAALLLLAGCAGTPGGGTGMTAIYSPPVRLGGTGSMIFLPRAARKMPPPLQTPDAASIAPTAAWLVGTWIPNADASDLDRVRCNSGTPVTYKADGTYWFFEGEGRWTLKGSRLTEVLTKAHDDEWTTDIGFRAIHIIRRVGPDEGLVLFDDGSFEIRLRCRPGDIAG